MPPEQGQFDLSQLFGAIEEARSDRGVTWAELSKEVGVATSTIRRFATASDAEADGVLALIRWLGVAPEAFVTNSTVGGVPLLTAGHDMALVDMVRVDMALLADLPNWPRRSNAGSRTTIQRLVTAAQISAVSVASLTRRSST